MKKKTKNKTLQSKKTIFSLLHDKYTSKCTPIYQACGTQDNKHIFQHFLWICGSYCAYVEYKSHTFFFSIKDLDYTVTEDSGYVQEATKTILPKLFYATYNIGPTDKGKFLTKFQNISFLFQL